MKLGKLITLILVLSVVSCAFASDQKVTGKTKTDLRSANMYFSQKNWDKALPLYLNILNADPELIEALDKSGSIYFDIKSEYFTANEYFDRTLAAIENVKSEYEEMKESNPKAAKKLAKAIKKGDYDEVVKRTNQLKVSCWVRLFNSGIGFVNEEKYDEAIQHLLKVKDLAPDSVKVKTIKLLAQSHSKAGNNEEEIEIYKEIHELDKTNISAIVIIAVDYFGKEDYENAAIWYMKASEVDSENSDHYANAATCYSNLKEEDKAKEMFLKVLEMNPQDVNAALNMSNFADKENDVENTLKYLKMVVDAEYEDKKFHETVLKDFCNRLSNATKYEELLIYAGKLKEYPDSEEYAIFLMNLAKGKLK